MIWGVISAFVGGFFLGFLFSGMLIKSPEDRRRDDDEQAEYMKKLTERTRRGRNDCKRSKDQTGRCWKVHSKD